MTRKLWMDTDSQTDSLTFLIAIYSYIYGVAMVQLKGNLILEGD